jgi:hypothetical protein
MELPSLAPVFVLEEEKQIREDLKEHPHILQTVLEFPYAWTVADLQEPSLLPTVQWNWRSDTPESIISPRVKQSLEVMTEIDERMEEICESWGVHTLRRTIRQQLAAGSEAW